MDILWGFIVFWCWRLTEEQKKDCMTALFEIPRSSIEAYW